MAEYTGKLWYDDSKDLHEGMIGLKEDDGNAYQVGYILPDSREEYGNLIVSAVNACISLNKENPLAVAEGMGDIIGALRGMVGVYYSTSGDSSPRAYEFAQQALASTERGK